MRAAAMSGRTGLGGKLSNASPVTSTGPPGRPAWRAAARRRASACPIPPDPARSRRWAR